MSNMFQCTKNCIGQRYLNLIYVLYTLRHMQTVDMLLKTMEIARGVSSARETIAFIQLLADICLHKQITFSMINVSRKRNYYYTNDFR